MEESLFVEACLPLTLHNLSVAAFQILGMSLAFFLAQARTTDLAVLLSMQVGEGEENRDSLFFGNGFRS